MIVTGGQDPFYKNTTEAIRADSWTQGIGVFDLTAMRWKNGYDAATEAYETPSVVKSWYSANGRYPVRWDDPAIEQLMKGDGK